ncbi:cytoplasmic protein [Cytobacillus depressus]|uniref:Cytoplasmic protein n=1 Tax=Cytobacillus depressus TaxID=1602942 RepID=A0A6L3V7S6_9BACI|nr:cytoplasmic protein [Cytobacillus depressus]KAB2333254.1 cytoplasmic protein [Cytobacillus depressus]
MGEKQNLVINGSGSYGGGAYHKIKIHGEGTITADFHCDTFKTYGTSSALKSGEARKFTIFGETVIHGNLTCEEMKIFGTANVGGSAIIEKASVFGTLDVGESFQGEEANIKGSLSVKGDTEFEKFNSTGNFHIGGLLNADSIQISLRFDTSKADEMGGNKITVKKKSAIFPFFKGEGTLEARMIEGDEISLENTKADIVRGRTVVIGTGCDIKLVEYESKLTVDKDSTILEQRKTGKVL